MLGSLLSVSSPLREVLLLPQFAASVLKQTHDSTKSVRREGDRPSGGVAKREPHGVHAASPSSLHRGGSARERRPPAAAASCVAACVTGTLRRSPREGASVRTTSRIRQSPASHGAPAHARTTCDASSQARAASQPPARCAREARTAAATCGRAGRRPTIAPGWQARALRQWAQTSTRAWQILSTSSTARHVRPRGAPLAAGAQRRIARRGSRRAALSYACAARPPRKAPASLAR